MEELTYADKVTMVMDSFSKEEIADKYISAFLFIEKMARLFAENRVDVTHMCNRFLTRGECPDEMDVEERMENILLPSKLGYSEHNLQIRYDTLSTVFSISKNGNDYVMIM